MMALEGGQFSVSWPVSKAMGGICKKYRKAKGQNIRGNAVYQASLTRDQIDLILDNSNK